MPRLLVSASALALLSTAAFAADLPLPVDPIPVAQAADPVYDWSGIYAGLQGGGVWGNVDFADVTNAQNFEYNIEGWKFGGHLGGQMQWHWVVLGVEGDIEWADVNGMLTAGNDSVSSDFNYQASIRGRLGVAFDRLLVYGTGGAAYADIDGTITNGGAAISEGVDISRWGWTAGGGVEFGVTQYISVGAEYRYTDLGDLRRTSAAAFPGSVYAWDTTEQAVRGRVTIRWGGAMQP
jgi:outer membrane immunogenic protein